MSGGIYMTRNIHDYEPNAGTAPPANSSVSGDTGTLQLCSADFIKLADTVLESANFTVGNLDITALHTAILSTAATMTKISRARNTAQGITLTCWRKPTADFQAWIF